jgi:Reverse transcriptase (RNA-dependent DNA polymerase)/gag-polyprotein putative aspartyl protease
LRINTLDIPLIFSSAKKIATEKVLLDSGATENFINPRMVKKLGIGTVELTQPRTVYNMDGTENQGGQIKELCILNILQGRKEAAQPFFVINLGKDQLILGYPWLKEFNPTIDWTQGTMVGLPIKLGTTRRSWKLKWAIHKIEARKTSISQHRAQQMGKDQNKVQVPERFTRYANIFSEEATKRFPPERPEDHKIELLPGAPWQIGGKIYKLTDEERRAITSFLQAQQEKGYMMRSNSQWASPFFYIIKKDGRLQPVFNYQKVNKWTVKDIYPLPQIDTIFDQIREAKLMSKFDIRDGYYNIWVHPDSWWATAVATEEGLFESKVMIFGLCNALATFQWMMDQSFSPIKQKYPKWIHWYMDNVIIATPDDQELHDQITQVNS